jgi:3-oxoacyl-[acyl-carrier-protein] synthase II
MSDRSRERRRIVVTGLGAVTPLGGDVPSTWEGALAGRSGVGPVTRFDAGARPVRIAAEVRAPLDPSGIPPKDLRRLDRCVWLAAVAAREALRDAGLGGEGEAPRDRFGVAIGSGIGGIGTLLENHRQLLAGERRLSPFFIPMTIANMAAGWVAIRHGLRGPNLCFATACSSGAHAIGEAARMIERGDADVMLAGGSEAAVNELVMEGFSALRALSTRNDEPERASRPFDAERDGFVLGEGAALLVLEALDHARARGARTRAELAGYAAGADAGHIAAPDESGEGAARCMAAALDDAGIVAASLGYVNAHATATPAGDRAEARAIRTVLGPAAELVPVSSTKSMTGHLLGASGALEALFCVRALETGWLPPTTNLEHPDPECALDHVAHKARHAPPRAALSNSFGFGGTNATLVLRRWEE